MTRPAIQRRFTVHANHRRCYGLDTSPAPFDAREPEQRPKPAAIRPADVIAREPDPLVRADATAELTDHDQLIDFAGPRPNIARRAFDLMAPDIANEKPMTAERRAAMHADRAFIITFLQACAVVCCCYVLAVYVPQFIVHATEALFAWVKS